LRSFEGGINFSGIVEADELLMQYSEKEGNTKAEKNMKKQRRSVIPK